MSVTPVSKSNWRSEPWNCLQDSNVFIFFRCQCCRELAAQVTISFCWTTSFDVQLGSVSGLVHSFRCEFLILYQKAGSGKGRRRVSCCYSIPHDLHHVSKCMESWLTGFFQGYHPKPVSRILLILYPWCASRPYGAAGFGSGLQETGRIFRPGAATVYDKSEIGGSSVMFKAWRRTDFYILRVDIEPVLLESVFISWVISRAKESKFV